MTRLRILKYTFQALAEEGPLGEGRAFEILRQKASAMKLYARVRMAMTDMPDEYAAQSVDVKTAIRRTGATRRVVSEAEEVVPTSN